jgi:hypothetical protein
VSTPPGQERSANGASPQAAGDGAVAALSTITAERPEILIGAAFAGGVVLAMLVRRLGR